MIAQTAASPHGVPYTHLPAITLAHFSHVLKGRIGVALEK